MQLFKSSLYNESSNAFASPAYVAGAATDVQPVSGNPQIRTEEPPYRARPGRGYWNQVLAEHQQNTASELSAKRDHEKLIEHSKRQAQLHDVGQPHQQDYCPKCRGPTYSYTVPQISQEAQKNHARMLNLMREASLNPKLLKSWYDNSEDPLAQNLLHKMGLKHNSSACPSCLRGETMPTKRLFE